jgi:hypothetical protein
MDIKEAYKQMVGEGLAPEEILESLTAELEKLFSMGEISEDEYSQALSDLQSMASGANGQEPNAQPQAEGEAEPEGQEMGQENEPVQEPMEQPIEQDDVIGGRASELVNGGEFEDYDEAYDYAMDLESSQKEGQGQMEQINNIAQKYLQGQIDENQLMEFLRMLKAKPLNVGAQQVTPQPKNKSDELKY